MAAILADALLVLLLLALTAFGVWQLFALSPAGVRRRQVQNRKRLERSNAFVCPVHGPCAEDDLVRVPSGETICPQCFREIQDVDLF
jgi:hypothetical protein